MEGTAHGGFQEFEQRRGTLLSLADRMRPIIAELDTGTSRDTLRRLRERIETDTFKVMVVGEFKRGKSTFINSLLGEQVLPAHSLPCTAVINEVKWSDTKRALLYPMPVDGVQGEPQEIPIDELAAFVTIPEGDLHSTSPYARAEVFWPLPLCENRVEIIDSPGLNEAPEREIITLGYLDQADALIVVMLATSAVSLNEQSFLDTHVTKRHDDAFFIFNRINDIDAQEREVAMRGIRRRLSPYSDRDSRIHFVDARSALRSRIAGDRAGFVESGVAAVEAELEQFLARDRGRAKLMVGARNLQGVVSENRRSITLHRGMLQRTRDELRASYDEAQGPLNALERKRLLILKRVDHHLTETNHEVEVAARAFYRRVASNLETWVEELDLEAGLKGLAALNPFGLEKRTAAIQLEVTQALSTRLQSVFAEWLDRELRTLLERRMNDLQTEIGDDLEALVTRADEIRYQLADMPIPPSSPTVSSAAERIAAAGAGLVLGGPGMALAGANLGFAGVVKAVLPTVGIIVGGAVLGIAALPVALGVIAVNAVRIKGQLAGVEAKIKKDVAKKYGDHIRENLDTMVGTLSAQVGEQMSKVRETIGAGLDAELRSVREGVEAALRKKESGEAVTQSSIQRLERSADELEAVDSALADFITAVVL